MKTPIQELIKQVEEWMIDDKYVQDNPLDYEEYMVHYANQMIEVKGKFIDMCKAMLKKEKEQIMNAYDAGWSDGVHSIDLNDEYYFETFKTNDK